MIVIGEEVVEVYFYDEDVGKYLVSEEYDRLLYLGMMMRLVKNDKRKDGESEDIVNIEVCNLVKV